jgi:hypothetical protein
VNFIPWGKSSSTTAEDKRKAAFTHPIDVVPDVPQKQHLVPDLDLRPTVFGDEAVEHVQDHFPVPADVHQQVKGLGSPEYERE